MKYLGLLLDLIYIGLMLCLALFVGKSTVSCDEIIISNPIMFISMIILAFCAKITELTINFNKKW